MLTNKGTNAAAFSAGLPAFLRSERLSLPCCRHQSGDDAEHKKGLMPYMDSTRATASDADNGNADLAEPDFRLLFESAPGI
jgi:hypothetical protein